MASNNPLLKESTFNGSRSFSDGAVMTLSGTINKIIGVLFLCFLSAGLTWSTLASMTGDRAGMTQGVLIGSVIGALIIGLITSFMPKISPFTAPLYAVLEGVVLGSVSLFFERAYHGIVFQAILLTFGVFFGLLFAFRTRLIVVTDKLRMIIFAATAAVAFVYIIGWVIGMFGMHIPYIHESGLVGIFFSGVVVVIASMNLLLDFDMIERGVQMQAPAYMEWYSAFALLVTLVWLYLEILRMLGKMRRR